MLINTIYSDYIAVMLLSTNVMKYVFFRYTVYWVQKLIKKKNEKNKCNQFEHYFNFLVMWKFEKLVSLNITLIVRENLVRL